MSYFPRFALAGVLLLGMAVSIVSGCAKKDDAATAPQTAAPIKGASAVSGAAASTGGAPQGVATVPPPSNTIPQAEMDQLKSEKNPGAR